MTVSTIDVLLREHQSALIQERRTAGRHPFTRPVRVTPPRCQSALQGFSRDVSQHGMSIILSENIRVGLIAELQIHSLTGDPVHVRAEARWCEPFGKGWFATGWKFCT